MALPTGNLGVSLTSRPGRGWNDDLPDEHPVRGTETPRNW